MRALITAAFIAVLIALGISPAAAANGYVLNDSASSVYVIGADNLYHQVRPGQSSALVTRDANAIVVGRGMCIWLEGRLQSGFGPYNIKVSDGQVRRITRLQVC